MRKIAIVDKDKKNKEKAKAVVFGMELYYDKSVKKVNPAQEEMGLFGRFGKLLQKEKKPWDILVVEGIQDNPVNPGTSSCTGIYERIN